MLKNYIKTAVRNMRHSKIFTLINIAGLTLGIAASLSLFSYIRDDLNWDGFHANKDRIYLVTEKERYEGADREETSMIVPPLAPALAEEIPDVEAASRFGICDRLVIHKDGQKYDAGFCCFADPDFLNIFSFPLLHGDPETALNRPDAILLHKNVARRFFGNTNPVGQTLAWAEDRTSIITGVYDIPEVGSHLQFNALCPINVVIADGRRMDDWRLGYVTGYVLLKKGIEPGSVSAKIPGIVEKYVGRSGQKIFSLRPLTDIHLKSNHIRISWNAGEGHILYTVSLGAIGLFLLLIAGINYTNLATARFVPRSKEVGMRKVIGATKKDLRIQFISESVLTAFIATLLAVGLVDLAKPWLTSLAGRPVQLGLTDSWTILGILGMTILVGIFAGLYPAFFLSAFQPVDVLKKSIFGAQKGLWFRRSLVVFQFVLSAILIIGVSVVYKQIRFMRNADLGFNHDQVMYVQISGIPPAMAHREALRDEFEAVPGVHKVGLSGSLPGLTFARSGIIPEGHTGDWAMDLVIVDDACLDVYQFQILQGRFISADFPSDNQWGEDGAGAIVLNETAADRLGWDNPIGKKIALQNMNAAGRVVGVVKDFHNQSLHEPIEPILLVDLGWDAFLNLRLSAENITEAIVGVRKTWSRIVPGVPFNYRFLNEEFERLYQNEKRIGSLAASFSGLAVFIASLGILGLTLFSTERRTKEIGIRKVLGATADSIVMLISREFLACVLLANILAWPVAYVTLNRWLNNFAFRTNIGIWPFLQAAFLSLIVATITISYQALRAAAANPADSLRVE